MSRLAPNLLSKRTLAHVLAFSIDFLSGGRQTRKAMRFAKQAAKGRGFSSNMSVQNYVLQACVQHRRSSRYRIDRKRYGGYKPDTTETLEGGGCGGWI